MSAGVVIPHTLDFYTGYSESVAAISLFGLPIHRVSHATRPCDSHYFGAAEAGSADRMGVSQPAMSAGFTPLR